MSQFSVAPVIGRVDAENRYEILVDGERTGLTAYRYRGEQRVFHHTEIDDAVAGQGLTSRLVQEALTGVRNSGKPIVPVRPYVAKFSKRHEEFADITDPVRSDVLR
ncbi:GNAT family N-acetyltransferase [Streptomyces sp. NPDC056831]|uniref:GNAT family N-acetyltransferase n=1 Tax=Streptomyces sp. NPDC056831 TaxID=3345954 RepID=UPI0036B3D4EC